MARISPDQVSKLARLAQLSLSPAEVDGYCREVGAILEFIDQLKQLDLANYQPTEQVTGLTNVTRADDLQELADNQSLLANAPQRDGNQIKVQRVLE